jgi:DNA-binding transcriptional ArsR family regulator
MHSRADVPADPSGLGPFRFGSSRFGSATTSGALPAFVKKGLYTGRHGSPGEGMRKTLWYLIAGTRGGKNRARIIHSLSDRPRNANQLADDLDLDYNTVRYHLDMLTDHAVLETSGDDYGKMYFLTDRFEHHRDTFERVTENME